MRVSGFAAYAMTSLLGVNGFASAQEIPKDGLVAWFPFNGNPNDAGGRGNCASVSGPGLSTDRFGTPNGCYSFDGVDDYLFVTQPVSFPFGDTPKSISVWYRSGAGGSTSMVFAGFGQASCGCAFQAAVEGQFRVNGYRGNRDRLTGIQTRSWLDGKWNRAFAESCPRGPLDRKRHHNHIRKGGQNSDRGSKRESG